MHKEYSYKYQDIQKYHDKTDRWYMIGLKIVQVFMISLCVMAVSLVAGGFGAYLATSKYAPQPIHVVEETHVTQLRQDRVEADVKLQKLLADKDKLIKNLQEQVRVLNSKVTSTDAQVQTLRHEPIPPVTDHQLEHQMRALGLHGKVVVK